jgi:hypothetical protein
MRIHKIIFLAMFLALAGCAASNTVTLEDGRQAYKTRGKTVEFSPEMGMLLISSAGNRMPISVGEGVELKGFQKITDIKEGDSLKVVYVKDDLGNYAVSIGKLPAGSCDN